MILVSDEPMELIVDTQINIASSQKSPYAHRESSGYSSKDPECSSPENKTDFIHLHQETIQPLSSTMSKSMEIDRRRHRILVSTTSVSNIVPLGMNESSLPTDPTQSNTVMCSNKSLQRRSYMVDERLDNFPLSFLSDDQLVSKRSSSHHQPTIFTHRHYHIYDWGRLSFYDNVPSAWNSLEDTTIIQDRSPISTGSTDRQDSGLESSSIEHHTATIKVTANQLHGSVSSLTSITTTNSDQSDEISSGVRVMNSRKIRVKWHSFTRTHRPSFNSSKYHFGQMSVGQLGALRRAATMRIQELVQTTRLFDSQKAQSRTNVTSRNVLTRQCLLASAFSAVPKLIIRRHQQRKEINHEMKKNVFGVSLLAMTQRTGHPVPITIISAMKYLRRTAMESVGLFRKPGVAHRIKRLHDSIESNPRFHQFDDFSPYDISDVLKQYFRFLPECLFTMKLSPVFLNINDYLSSAKNKGAIVSNDLNERRLILLQYAILLLPDEHRLVLHLILSFLNDVSQHSKTNQMSAKNLATCFAPTLFSFSQYEKSSTNLSGMPDLREIQDQRKAMEILSFMIDHVRLLFLLSNELNRACHFSYIEIGEPCTLEELARRVSETTKTSLQSNKSIRKSNRQMNQRSKQCTAISASDSIGSLSSSSCENLLIYANNNNNNNNNNNSSSRSIKIHQSTLATKGATSYQSFIDRCIAEVIRESCYTKFKGWTSFGKTNELGLAFKKLDDGHPLGLWKSSIDIEAPPIEILNRLLTERHLWDDDFQSGSIIEQLDPNTQVYQYTINSMAPLASRYFCEVRSWRYNVDLNIDDSSQSDNISKQFQLDSCNPLPSLIHLSTHCPREACVLVCTSIEHPKARCPPTIVRAVTLASRYLIQSIGCGKSKVTHLSRVDLMGRSADWYTKVYGSILARTMTKLRDSFMKKNSGPETKI